MKTTTLWCEAGKHHWERESKRGRKPANCPEHSQQPVLIEKVSAKPLSTQEKKRRMDAGKAAKKAEREKEQAKEQRAELKRLTSDIPKLDRAWKKTFAQACKAVTPEDIKARFAKADAAQNTLLRTRKRIRQLES